MPILAYPYLVRNGSKERFKNKKTFFPGTSEGIFEGKVPKIGLKGATSYCTGGYCIGRISDFWNQKSHKSINILSLNIKLNQKLLNINKFKNLHTSMSKISRLSLLYKEKNL